MPLSKTAAILFRLKSADFLFLSYVPPNVRSAGQSPFIQIIPYIILEYFRFVKNFIRICTRILQILFWRISSIFRTAAIGNFDKLFSGNPFDFCRYRYIILRQHRTKTIYWILHVSCLHIFSLAQKITWLLNGYVPCCAKLASCTIRPSKACLPQRGRWRVAPERLTERPALRR